MRSPTKPATPRSRAPDEGALTPPPMGQPTRQPLAPAAFAGRITLVVVIVLVARAVLVWALDRAGAAQGYGWNSFLATVPGALAGVVLGSRTPRRPHASWAATAQVAVAIALVHLALSVVMGRLVGFDRPPAGELGGLALAAGNAGIAVLIGAWAGRRVTRVGERLHGGAPDASPPNAP